MVPTMSQGVRVSSRKTMARMVANSAAVLTNGVARVTPTAWILTLISNLPNAKLNRPPKANQANAIIANVVISLELKITAKDMINSTPGMRDTQVPVVGLRYCRPIRTSTALQPQHEAAIKANKIPNIFVPKTMVGDTGFEPVTSCV